MRNRAEAGKFVETDLDGHADPDVLRLDVHQVSEGADALVEIDPGDDVGGSEAGEKGPVDDAERVDMAESEDPFVRQIGPSAERAGSLGEVDEPGAVAAALQRQFAAPAGLPIGLCERARYRKCRVHRQPN